MEARPPRQGMLVFQPEVRSYLLSCDNTTIHVVLVCEFTEQFTGRTTQFENYGCCLFAFVHVSCEDGPREQVLHIMSK